MKLRNQDSKGLGCLALFALPFAAVGVFMGFSAIRQLATWVDARDWDAVPAYVEHVELEEHQGDDSTTYSVEASYSYTVLGETYRSDRVWLTPASDNIGDFHHRIYRQLDRARTSGEPTVCFVDPDEPSRALISRELRPKMLFFNLMFVFVFGGVGFGLLAAVPYIRRVMKKEAEARALYPDEPWRWKNPEASNRIRSSDRIGMWFWIGFAAFWNAISWPVVLLAFDEIRENRAALLVLVFPAVGLGLAFYAARAILRWRRFGASEFELSDFPAPIGGQLSGRVLTSARLREAASVTARLDCHRRVGSGKNSRQQLIWQDETSIHLRDVQFDGRHSTIPLTFAVPHDAASSIDSDIKWTLTVQGDLPGTDYESSFQVPVYSVAHEVGLPPPPPLDDERFQAHSPHEAFGATPWPNGISVEPLPSGGHRYRFGRNRHPGGTFGLLFFLIVWLGATYFVIHAGAPLFLTTVFSLSGVLVAGGVLLLGLGHREIEANSKGLKLRSGIFRLGREKFIPSHEIERLRITRGTQIGQKLLQRIVAESNGRKTTAASQLDTLVLARRILRQLKSDLGLHAN